MVIQFLIILTGGLAILFTQQNKYYILKKYAPILGLIGQPFWFYTSYTNEQWGIFILSFFYSYAWYIGIKNYWLRKENELF